MIDLPTRAKRTEFFMRRDFTEHITDQQKKNHLSALNLIRRMPVGLRRIGRSDLPEREVALKKALFVSRRSAKLADARIDAEMSVFEFEKMDPERKFLLWNQYYETAVNRFKQKPVIRDDEELMKQLVFLQKFFSLPAKIYEEREAHWTIIEKVLKRLVEKKIDPAENFRLELDRIVRKAKMSNGNIKIFAMDVCVASSIYADMKGREGKNWSEAYQYGMEIAYSKIKEFPALVDAIVSF
jgi:hypothetical protein